MATISTSSSTLDQVRGLYDRGLYRQAHDAGAALGPLQDWPDTDGQVLAGRLAGNLGARRISSGMHLRAWRKDPAHPEACLYYVFAVSGRRGPLAALQAWQACRSLQNATAELLADWYALRARIAAMLRDFDTAERWMKQALASCDSRPWPWVERSSILETQDQSVEALESVQHALRLQPWFRPAVQVAGGLLQQLNRDDEALELLGQASQRLESGDLFVQLAVLQSELELYPQARDSWRHADELLLLKDKEYKSYLASRHCDAAYYCDDIDQCLRWAEQTDQPFFKTMAENVKAAPPDAKSVRLPVGFVRQHHMTCVPATLSALSGYWKIPAEHLDIAEKICYDGTPSHSERRWAEQNGFIAREFKVTWDATVSLLDRGLPFTLTTVDPGNAHMQGVIGYDARRGTLLIREPTFRVSTEFLAIGLEERYASTGPRGMVLIPRALADLLEGLDFPDADLYDRLYRMESALQRHDRQTAADELAGLLTVAPGHRLTILARRAMASYDSNLQEMLAATDEHLKLYPADTNAQMSQLSLLTQLSRRQDRLQRLHEICEAPQADPIVKLQYVREFIDDAREHTDLTRRLRQIIRFRPQLAEAYHQLARIEWGRQRRDAAVDLFRFAACLDDKEERYSQDFFVAARYVRRAPEALDMLRGRYRRFGSKSSRPARTLSWALAELGQTDEARQVLEDALGLRPDDGELLLHVADFVARIGCFQRAAELLGRAESCSHRSLWCRTAANVAMYRGDKATACGEYQAIVADEPLSSDAQRAYTQLLADTKGVEQALTHLRGVVKRFPHHYLLNQLLVEWLREHDRASLGEVLEDLVEAFPNDAWMRRELAVVYAHRRDYAAALREAQIARDLEPAFSWSWSVLGFVHAQAGSMPDARQSLRRAIELSVDNESAIVELFNISDTPAERMDAIVFIYEQLCRQITFGSGLLAWREMASGILDGFTLLHVLIEALQARPDLWQAWSATTQQAMALGQQLDYALRIASMATERFPLLPNIWTDLAEVHRRRDDLTGERESLNRALSIDPRWNVAVRQLANSYERENDLECSRQLLEQLLAYSPLDAANHGWLAAILWQTGRKDEAIERLKTAVRLHPGYEWAWSNLSYWGSQIGQPNLAREVAAQLTQERPGEARSWLVLAQVLSAAGEVDGAIDALGKSTDLNPRCTEAFDLRAKLLAEKRAYEEALAACQPAAFGDSPPLELRGRGAWVEAQRGRLPEAIQTMEQILRESPAYFWGLGQLADWYERAQRWDNYRWAGQRLVELAPYQALSYGHRGSARLQSGDREGAKADWHRAIQLDPAYTYAGLSLADLYLEQRDPDAAQEVLNSLSKHTPSDFITAREVQVACVCRDADAARARLIELCALTGGNQGAIRMAADTYSKTFGSSALRAALQEWFTRSDANPDVAALLVLSHAARGSFWKCRRLLKQVPAATEAWRRAAVAYLSSALDRKKHSLLWPFIKGNWQALRADTWTWGYAAEVLSQANLRRQVLKWCADWREQKDLTPRILFYYAINLRYLFRFDQAREVQQFALTLPPDGAEHTHRLMLLVDDFATHGLPGAAAQRFGEINGPVLGDFYRELWEMSKEWIEVMSPPALIAEGYSAAAKRLKTALGRQFPAYRQNGPFKRWWHLLLAQLAASRGRPWLMAWHEFRASTANWL